MKKEMENGKYIAPQVDVMDIQGDSVLCISGTGTLDPLDSGTWMW